VLIAAEVPARKRGDRLRTRRSTSTQGCSIPGAAIAVKPAPQVGQRDPASRYRYGCRYAAGVPFGRRSPPESIAPVASTLIIHAGSESMIV
jgi:hypothetical protein